MSLIALSEIPGFLEADEPSSWAYDNLAIAGEGHHAIVYAHPTREDVVIRVAPFPEGFFGYAAPVDDQTVSPHVPRYLDMALVGDTLIAACERLKNIAEDDIEATAWITIAVAITRGQIETVDDETLDAFLKAQPDFETFVETTQHRLSDLRRENWMLRGRMLVLNDPVSMMTAERAAAIEAEFRIDRPQEMTP